MIKLNTLLAKVDHSQSMFNRMVGDYAEDARYMGTTNW